MTPIERHVALPLLNGTGRARGVDGCDSGEAKEKCGVFGIWGGADPAASAYMGLRALQHRGQESAGIAVSNGRELTAHTGMGLVSEVFGTHTLAMLREAARPHEVFEEYKATGETVVTPAPPASVAGASGVSAQQEELKSMGESGGRERSWPQFSSTQIGASCAESRGSAALVGSSNVSNGRHENGRTAGSRGRGRVGVPMGCGAIGHNRYSTAGGSKSCNAQPLLESYVGGQVAVAHNGNLINAHLMRAAFERAGHLFHTTSDTEVIIHLLASPAQQGSHDPLGATLRHLQGAFSLVFLFPDRMEVARDPWGWRPLVIGQLADGRYAAASETVALDVVGAKFLREVEPGEIVTISDAGVSSRRYAEPAEKRAHCIFEHVYFANPSSNVFGQNVQIVREELGVKLAQEAPVKSDYVMPMPDSGRSAAAGYARASGIPYREGIVPNRYVGRTFIKPTQEQRAAAVRLKLNVIREIVEGKRIIVVDDSIVRGTTTRVKMNQLREAGAKEIHLRISCPPIRHPCYFGVDFATRDQLIADQKTVEEIRKYLGVDSLHFLTLEGMLSCVSRAPEHYCTACYTGDYRLDPSHPETGEIATRQMGLF